MTSKIDRLFGSKTRVQILSKLLMNPDKSFYLRELSRELKIPYSMLYKEEKNLVSLGIAAEEKRGKVTLVSANRNLPFFTELKNMMVKTAGLGDLLRNALSELGETKYALIYGSFASGEESGSSDIDLMVIGTATEDKLLDITSKIEKEVKREINYILWSEDEFIKRAKAEHHLLRDIAAKPVIMLVGEENEFRRTVKK
jgi:predicted nucleotidyltransferase